MTNIFTVACVQNTAGPAMETNLVEVAELVRHAKTKGAELVCLPEFFSCLEARAMSLNSGPWMSRTIRPSHCLAISPKN